jgi:predicted acetyltransferase
MDTRVIKANELPQFRTVLGTAFGDAEPSSVWNPVWENVFEADRLLGAFENDTMLGTAGNFSFTMTVPGGELPTAGLTVVGVLPTHRRRGIASALMRAQIDDARAHREPLSILWASEASIYQRFGYGPAVDQMNIQVDRGDGEFLDRTPPAGRVRLLTDDDALKVLPDIYDRVRPRINGLLARDTRWWQYHRLFDPKEDRDGAGKMFKVVWEDEGRADAYALYRVKEKWDPNSGLPKHSLWVYESAATSAIATKELWRYLFSMDLVSQVTGFFMPVDHALLRMIVEVRRLHARLNDAVWLRIVDLEEALTQRSYADEGSVVLDVIDTFCEWNTGRWKLTSRSSGHSLDEVQGDADLVLDIRDLGAVYLGGNTFAQLAHAGRVEETSPGGIARADALFNTDNKPWCPEIF